MVQKLNDDLVFKEEGSILVTLLLFVNEVEKLNEIKEKIVHETVNFKAVQFGEGVYAIFKKVELGWLDLNWLANNANVFKIILEKDGE